MPPAPEPPSTLSGGPAEPDPDLTLLEAQVHDFRQRYRGQVAQLSGAELLAALEELVSLWRTFLGIPEEVLDTEAVWQWLERRITLQSLLLFFPLE
ncbi:MAG: hypothetical protein Q6K92_05515, partial [Thermostichus sp. DG_1_5_bins_95]